MNLVAKLEKTKKQLEIIVLQFEEILESEEMAQSQLAKRQLQSLVDGNLRRFLEIYDGAINYLLKKRI